MLWTRVLTLCMPLLDAGVSMMVSIAGLSSVLSGGDEQSCSTRRVAAGLLQCNAHHCNVSRSATVYSIKDVLTTYYGFQPADITVMVDTDQTTTQPTGRNIKAALRSLVAAAQDGDVLFVHYSGHGTQACMCCGPSQPADE